jgi:hypothetical protein
VATPNREDTLRTLLDLADRMRRNGGASREILHNHCERALEMGQLGFDDYTVVYRHLAIHAGAIQPTHRYRLHVCPVCEAVLDMPE